MKRKILLTLGLSALMISLTGCSTDKEVAKINGESVKQSVLYEQMVKDYGEDTLATYLIDKSLENDFSKEVTEEQIEERYNQDVQSYGGSEQFESMLTMYNMGTPKEYKKQIKQILYLEASAKADTKLTDEDIDAKFKTLINMEVVQTETLEEAQNVIKQLNDGKDLDEASKSDSSYSFGSDWYVNTEAEDGLSMSTEVTQASLKLKDGEHTKEPVIVDEDGEKYYYVVQVIVNPTTTDKKATEFKDEIADRIYQDKLDDSDEVTKLVKKSLKNNKVEISDDSLKDALSTYGIE